MATKLTNVGFKFDTPDVTEKQKEIVKIVTILYVVMVTILVTILIKILLQLRKIKERERLRKPIIVSFVRRHGEANVDLSSADQNYPIIITSRDRSTSP